MSPIFICIFILTTWIPSISAFYGNFVVCTSHAQCASGWCGPTDQSNATVCLHLHSSNNACNNDRECRYQLCSNNKCVVKADARGISSSPCTTNMDCSTDRFVCRVESNECGSPGSRVNIRDAGCGVSEHCDTATCDFINGICTVRSCTTHYQCPRDMFCGPDGNQANAPKTCKKKERAACSTPLQCESGMCSGFCLYPAAPVPVSQLYRSEEMFPYTVPQGEYCFSSQHCVHGLYCAPGDVCMPKLNLGQQCRSVEACISGYCKGGICVAPGSIGTWCTSDANCTSSNYCGPIAPKSTKKQCMMKGTIGASCTIGSHNMCESGNCDSGGRCSIVNGLNADCSVNAPCSYDTYCDTASTNKCKARIAANSQCTNSTQCMSGVCLDGAPRYCNVSTPGTYGHFCSSSNSNSDCDAQHYCRGGNSPVICIPKGDRGAACSSNFQCLSNTCYGSPARCIIPGEIGTSCTSNLNCTAGSYCPILGTRICTPLLGLGEKCTTNQNVSCASGWCSGNLCHSPPAARSAGSSCVTHTDCNAGLWCWSTPDGISTCHPKRSDGNKCLMAETCISNLCENNICGGSPNPNGYVIEGTTTSPGGGGGTTPTPTMGAGGTPSAGATTSPPTSTPAPGSNSTGSNSGSLYVPTTWSLLLGMLSLMILV